MKYFKWTAVSLAAVLAGCMMVACQRNIDDAHTVPERGVPAFVSITLFGIPALEGLVTDESGAAEESRAFRVLEPTVGMEFGPTEGRRVVARGIFTFDIVRIPDGAEIESARLNVFQSSIAGDPYEFIERILVDHIDTSQLTELNSDLFAGSTLQSDIGTISVSPIIAFKVLDVTEQVQMDVNAADRDTSSFRLRAQKERLVKLEGLDAAFFSDSLDEFGNVPVLDVIYKNPDAPSNKPPSDQP